MTQQETLLKSAYSESLEDNVAKIETILESSVDLLVRPFVLHKGKDIRARMYFTDGLAKAAELEQVLTGLIAFTDELLRDRTELTAKELKEHLMLNFSVTVSREIGEGITAILTGDTLLLVDGIGEGLIVGTRGWDMRSVAEPATETVVRGPRDGFTENIRTNTAIMRRRIRDPNLRIEGMQVGVRSKTDVNIAYIKDIVKEGLVEEVARDGDEPGVVVDDEAAEGHPLSIPRLRRSDIAATCNPTRRRPARHAYLVDGSRPRFTVP